MYNNELYHHGIKGQKWGVRNGPPYPLESYKSEAVKKFGSRTGKLSLDVKTDSKIYNVLSVAIPMAMGTVLLSNAIGFAVPNAIYGLVMLANSMLTSARYFNTAKQNLNEVTTEEMNEEIMHEGEGFVHTLHLDIPMTRVHSYMNEAQDYIKQNHLKGDQYE